MDIGNIVDKRCERAAVVSFIRFPNQKKRLIKLRGVLDVRLCVANIWTFRWLLLYIWIKRQKRLRANATATESGNNVLLIFERILWRKLKISCAPAFCNWQWRHEAGYSTTMRSKGREKCCGLTEAVRFSRERASVKYERLCLVRRMSCTTGKQESVTYPSYHRSTQETIISELASNNSTNTILSGCVFTPELHWVVSESAWKLKGLDRTRRDNNCSISKFAR